MPTHTGQTKTTRKVPTRSSNLPFISSSSSLPPTHTKGNWLDFTYGCKIILHNTSKIGFFHGTPSDHLALSIDISPQLFGINTYQPHQQRFYWTKIPVLTQCYWQNNHNDASPISYKTLPLTTTLKQHKTQYTNSYIT